MLCKYYVKKKKIKGILFTGGRGTETSPEQGPRLPATVPYQADSLQFHSQLTNRETLERSPQSCRTLSLKSSLSREEPSLASSTRIGNAFRRCAMSFSPRSE